MKVLVTVLALFIYIGCFELLDPVGSNAKKYFWPVRALVIGVRRFTKALREMINERS